MEARAVHQAMVSMIAARATNQNPSANHPANTRIPPQAEVYIRGRANARISAVEEKFEASQSKTEIPDLDFPGPEWTSLTNEETQHSILLQSFLIYEWFSSHVRDLS
jgi:hypothetical protein